MLDMIKNAMGLGSTVDYTEMKKRNALILDVRSRAEFQSGHFKDAKNIPLDELSNHIASLKKEERPIITCCMSGARSGAAARQLEAEGIEAHNGGNWSQLGNAYHQA
ncbi:MAG: sulfurtransferase [Flavobacteriales bacterium]|nr:sulfurtransferase [Flavobacteriales bacterium]|tara:strand:+ start:589 stop:909 length:321 start_codon:yes stop_codon:yes gene_type:complete